MTSNSLRAVICGGGIAGPTAAYWLARAGWHVTIIERDAAPRPSGQNIDVRGAARQVVERMGLLEAVRERGTGETGTRFVDEQGDSVSELDVTEGEGDGPTAELEIMRPELARLVAQACDDDQVTWRWDDQVVDLRHDDSGVDVHLQSGEHLRCDLLVVAEGVRSTTRDLAFDDVQLDRLGMCCVFGTIARTGADDDTWRIFHAPGSLQASLRPTGIDPDAVGAMLNFLTDDPEVGRLDRPGILDELRRRYDGVGWEVPRVLDAFADADDLYVDDLTQVRMPAWSSGRVAVLGDAAWCVTPVGGAGTTLALTGGYVLAAMVSQATPTHDGLVDALQRYERWMRPKVEDVQDLPPGVPRLAAPATRAGVAALRVATKVIASRPVRSITDRALSFGGEDDTLPEMRHA